MKILVADDHPLVLQALCSYLAVKKQDVICRCNNGIDAWNNLLLLKPDIALLDHSMPGMTGMEIAERIYTEKVGIRVVMLTMHKEKLLFDKAVAAGVKGYLLKDFAFQEIEDCLKSVDKDISYYSKQLTPQYEVAINTPGRAALGKLTPAEQKILHIIARKKKLQEIADMLFIPLSVVEEHNASIIKKLGLQPGTDSIAAWAAENIK